MDLINQLPVVAWQIVFAVIALIIPVLLLSRITRLLTKSGKKTYHSIRH